MFDSRFELLVLIVAFFTAIYAMKGPQARRSLVPVRVRRNPAPSRRIDQDWR